MSDVYPRMLFRDGTEYRVWDEYDVAACIVGSVEEENEALATGWRLTPNPLDHDGDGKSGGARRGRPPKQQDEAQ